MVATESRLVNTLKVISRIPQASVAAFQTYRDFRKFSRDGEERVKKMGGYSVIGAVDKLNEGF